MTESWPRGGSWPQLVSWLGEAEAAPEALVLVLRADATGHQHGHMVHRMRPDVAARALGEALARLAAAYGDRDDPDRWLDQVAYDAQARLRQKQGGDAPMTTDAGGASGILGADLLDQFERWADEAAKLYQTAGPGPWRIALQAQEEVYRRCRNALADWIGRQAARSSETPDPNPPGPAPDPIRAVLFEALADLTEGEHHWHVVARTLRALAAVERGTIPAKEA